MSVSVKSGVFLGLSGDTTGLGLMAIPRPPRPDRWDPRCAPLLELPSAAAPCTALGRAGGRQAPLTCLGRGVLLAPLEGVPEEQLIAPAARAHQDHADGAGIVPHPAGARAFN